jgi:hypothetical protein
MSLADAQPRPIAAMKPPPTAGQIVGGVQADIDEDDLEGDHGEQGADRVVDDRFPAQQRGRAGVELGLAEKRHDHRRAGDHENGAEHDGRGPAQPADIMGGKRAHAPDHAVRHT